MFSVTQYQSMPFNRETYPVILDDETLKGERLYNMEFRIRRLDGNERLDFYDIERTKEKSKYRGQIEFVLARCILDGDTNKSIGNVCARNIIGIDFKCALKLFDKILDFSEMVDKEEKTVEDEEVKNSDETDTLSTTDDSANATA